MAALFESLNDDVLQLIVDAVAELPEDHLIDEPYLSSPIGNLALTCKRLRLMCFPFLFRVIDLSDGRDDRLLIWESKSDLDIIAHTRHLTRALSLDFDVLNTCVYVQKKSKHDNSRRTILSLDWTLQTLLSYVSLKELHIVGWNYERDLEVSLGKLEFHMPSVETLHVETTGLCESVLAAFPNIANIRINWNWDDVLTPGGLDNYGRINNIEVSTDLYGWTVGELKRKNWPYCDLTFD